MSSRWHGSWRRRSNPRSGLRCSRCCQRPRRRLRRRLTTPRLTPHRTNELEPTMATWDFARSEPIDANIRVASGAVTLTAEPTDAITVQVHRGRQGDPARDNADDDHVVDDVTVEFADRHLVVSELPRRGLGWRSKDLPLTIRKPTCPRSPAPPPSRAGPPPAPHPHS